MSQAGGPRRPPPRGAAASRGRPPRAAATTTTTTTTTRKKTTTSQVSFADRRKAAEQKEIERRQQELRERGIDPEQVKAKAGTFLKRGQGRRIKQRSSAEKAEDLRRKEEARAIRLREKGPAILKGALSQARGRPPARVVEQVEQTRQSQVTVTQTPARRAAATPAAAAARPPTPVQAQQMPAEVVLSPPRIAQEQSPAVPSPEQAMARARTPPPPPEVAETLEHILLQHEYVEKLLTLRHVVRQQRFRRRFMTSALTPVQAINQAEEEREIEKEVQRLMRTQRFGREVVIPPLEEGPIPPPLADFPALPPHLLGGLEGEGLLDQEAPVGILPRPRTPSPRVAQLPQPPPELEQIMGMLWQCKQLLKEHEFAALVQRILARDFKIDSDIETIPSSEYDSEGDLNAYAEPGVRQLLEGSTSLAPGRFSPSGRGPAARALARLLNY